MNNTFELQSERFLSVGIRRYSAVKGNHIKHILWEYDVTGGINETIVSSFYKDGTFFICKSRSCEFFIVNLRKDDKYVQQSINQYEFCGT